MAFTANGGRYSSVVARNVFLRRTVKICQFLCPAVKFKAVLRLSVDPIETFLIPIRVHCDWVPLDTTPISQLFHKIIQLVWVESLIYNI